MICYSIENKLVPIVKVTVPIEKNIGIYSQKVQRSPDRTLVFVSLLVSIQCPHKTEILPSCNRVCTIAWMHHQDSNEALWTEARLEPHKDAEFCFRQILEATRNKTTAVRTLTAYLTNHPGKTTKTCWVLLEKQGQIHEQRSSVDSDTLLHQCWLTSENLHTSTLCRHRTPCGWHDKEWLKKMAWQSQKNQCYKHDLMMMMMMMTYIYIYIYIY